LWGIHRDKKCLDTSLFGVLHNALRCGSVFVDVSSQFVNNAHEIFEVDACVQLEELHLTWLCGID